MQEPGKFLLIVDDNLLNLQLTAGMLRQEGFRISLAQDGPSALTQLETLTPDLMLLDIMMPVMDGLELCRRIKNIERFRDTPVIFLTAKNRPEDLAEGFKAGGVDYITKPFNREELIIRLNNHLELAHSKKRIVEMNKTRDKLYSVIAHDIRSPFSNIVLTLNTLAGGFLDPVSDDFMEIIRTLEKSANETRILLDNLLDWTRLQNENLVINLRNTKIDAVISHCLHLFQGSIDNKNIRIESDVPMQLTAMFDELSMKAVFRNILFNAVKFTPEGGLISIKASEEDGWVSVIISDSGVGMSEDIIKKVFNNSEHYTSAGTANESGSGLGSFIIRDFVEKNRGRLKVVSTPGKGTSITVMIPVSA